MTNPEPAACRPVLSLARTAASVLAGALALVACGPSDAGEARTATHSVAVEDRRAIDDPPPLTAEGWGPLRIGMSRAEMVAALGEDANPHAVGGPDPETCDQLRPERAPEGMLVMLERGRVTRISLSHPAQVRTASGIGIGDRGSEVRAAYGADLDALPHKYRAVPAEYLTIWTKPPPDPEARGVRYEIDVDGLVFHIHAGGPSIEYVEGCL